MRRLRGRSAWTPTWVLLVMVAVLAGGTHAWSATGIPTGTA